MGEQNSCYENSKNGTKPSPSLSHSIVSLLSPTQPSATRKLDIDFEQKYEPDIGCVKDAADNSTISLNSNEDAPAATPHSKMGADNPKEDCSSKMRASTNVVLAHALGGSIFDNDIISKGSISNKKETYIKDIEPSIPYTEGANAILNKRDCVQENESDKNNDTIEHMNVGAQSISTEKEVFRPDISYESDIDERSITISEHDELNSKICK